ncbi:LytTR family DNA-binding domain-containing protein [Flaviaesturariibacter amylovorans]|uniref:LytTR family DNA-binding domain-containing protein n=1 Tax=Flaviaesturariibacter amylovorans TaxID=1084520 RepID=A0ABP8H0N4_9BACT
MLHERVRCLIVEDEDDAVRVLRHYLAQVPRFELLGVCRDTQSAEQWLREASVDLLFLDINLPGKSGIEWLRGLDARTRVIFTTADAAFGAEGYELDAVDYLLKPFSYERFARSLDRYLRLYGAPAAESPAANPPEERPFLMVRAGRLLQKIYLDEVWYIEAKRNHLLVYGDAGELKVYQSMSSLEDRLPQRFFLRIHRSFIVATGRVRAFSATAVQVGAVRLPVGRSYGPSVQAALAR